MWDIVLKLAGGIDETLRITGSALLIGLIAGLPLVALRKSKHLVLRWIGSSFIDVARAVPPVVWLFLIFYGVGSGALRMTPFQAAVIGLGLVSSAYIAEIYRAGLEAVDPGQKAACKALGVAPSRAYAFVIVPQALAVVIAPTTTYAISLLKDSALASIIGAVDITYLAFQETQMTLQGLSVFLVAGLLYLLLSLPIAALGRVLDRAVARRFA